jgi:hypothetical protein
MSRDFADFLAALNEGGAAYVVIGGIAVQAHVMYRVTRDIDVLIKPTLDNARKVRAAIGRWAGSEPIHPPEDFVSGDILSFGGVLRVEVHSRVPGVTFDRVWANRIRTKFLGVPTDVASIDDLIAMKSATGRREKDLPDLRRLRKLKADLDGSKARRPATRRPRRRPRP